MEPVQPLRISKNTPSSTPNKMAQPRPLSEIGEASLRRNSPSYGQKVVGSRESSPYTDGSSLLSEKVSPRAFWSSRETMSPSRFDENTPDRSSSPLSSPKRRTSIERLKQASRVRNSNIFALENKDVYDPMSVPVVERPAANRPLSQQLANNAFHRYDSLRKEHNPLQSPQRPGHKRSDSQVNVPLLSPSREAAKVPLPASPEKRLSPSPQKSSMARTSRFGASSPGNFDPENGTWSDDDRAPTPRALHRHNKSVTFQAEPPVVNEYEQQTPEPSLSAGSREGSWDSNDFDDQDMSFDRGSSSEASNRDGEDSFDDDLENTEKTPVVLPEDWSRMSPEEARVDLVDRGDDVFDVPTSPQSVTSDTRPLPPLPGYMTGSKASERGSISRDDVLNMRRQLSSENDDEHSDNKRLTQSVHGIAEELSTGRDARESMDRQVHVHEAPVEEDSFMAGLAEFANTPPRISRESILRNVRNSKYDFEDDDSDVEESMFDESFARPSYAEMACMDPDQPIPSKENSRGNSATYAKSHSPPASDGNEAEVYIKDEPADDEIDLHEIPSMDESQVDAPRSPSRMDNCERQSSVIHHPVRSDSSEEDETSYYSSVEPEAESTVLHHEEPETDDGKETLQDAMELLTVKDYSESQSAAKEVPPKTWADFMGLPSYLSGDDYKFGMDRHIAPSPPASNESTQKLSLDMAPMLQPPAQLSTPPEAPRQPYDGVHRDVSPPETPESNAQHRDSEVSSLQSYEQQEAQPEPEHGPVLPKIPDIPERRSTIRTGGRLKARPSATSADFAALAEQQRTFSQEHPVPAVPAAYRAEVESAEAQATVDEQSQSFPEAAESAKADSGVNEKPARRRESSGMKLDIPLSAGEVGDLSTGLDLEFDRVIESQKKGYHMRENAKVVVASNRNFSNESSGTTSSKASDAAPMSPTTEGHPPRGIKSAGSSPRKTSAEQFLKTEPWNGQTRRKSMRNASAQKAYAHEPAPPLPGQESALGVVDEDFATGTGSLEDDEAEGVERGRLFVKVVGVKDLDMPTPKNDRIFFQLTLDNGLHCVTTADLEFGRNAPIGQEFELVVLNDLDFQLTLTTQLPPPPAAPIAARSSPTKPLKSPAKSGFSRFLSTPKKRAERERQEREAAEAEERRLQEEARRKRASVQPTAWDLMHELVNAADGSFARAYVNLKSHEQQCFGRPLTVDVPCYNEWALEKDSQIVNSVRSKRGTHAGPVRRPPYVVGNLELQLLYVPKPKGATDEEMPKSMGSAIREMSKAGEAVELVHEGHLSQQGGDCKHWRRRFFRVQGSRLTAYHEHTHQKRAVINLSKASRLVDDKSTLVADPASQLSSKGRRKSAFAEEDEGYQYVEEGFRIRFANGETIDFYADSHADKDKWMQVLSQVVGKPSVEKNTATWTDLVLARERGEARKSAAGSTSSPSKEFGTSVRDFTKPPAPAPWSGRKPVPPKDESRTASGSPTKSPFPRRAQPLSQQQPRTPPLASRGHRSRGAARSMKY